MKYNFQSSHLKTKDACYIIILKYSYIRNISEVCQVMSKYSMLSMPFMFIYNYIWTVQTRQFHFKLWFLFEITQFILLL